MRQADGAISGTAATGTSEGGRRLGQRLGIDNPVLARELKERMRTRRAAVTLTIYLVVLASIVQLLYQAASRSAERAGGVDALMAATLGRSMFETLLFFMLLLVCFLVPGLTAGAIVGERERQTLVPLQITLLGPGAILAGKLAASLAFLLLLVVATVPLMSVSFLVGGVTLWEALRGVGMVVATGVTLACVAMGCSAVARRSQAATVAAYGITLVLVVGTFVAYGFQNLLLSGHGARNPAIFVVNPLVATADAVGGRSPASPLSALRSIVRRGREEAEFVQGPVVRNGDQPVVGRGEGQPGFGRLVEPERSIFVRVPFSLWSLLCWAGLCGVSLSVAAARLRLPAASDRQ